MVHEILDVWKKLQNITWHTTNKWSLDARDFSLQSKGVAYLFFIDAMMGENLAIVYIRVFQFLQNYSASHETHLIIACLFYPLKKWIAVSRWKDS